MVNQDPEYLAGLRREYTKATLNPGDLPAHPVDAFAHWFDYALTEGVHEPNAMVLGTVSNNRPSSRVVLLKELTLEGVVFYTNYLSRKGREIAENPFACVNFFWWQQERQIRIEGKIEKISEAENQKYFRSRPRMSQAGAIVSNQSARIESREELDNKMAELMALPENVELQKPEHWGGFRLIPDYFEFWQGRAGRVHDRIVYELSETGWEQYRLQP
jgi:pyridoxamine 5'-phosphate oxidase